MESEAPRTGSAEVGWNRLDQSLEIEELELLELYGTVLTQSRQRQNRGASYSQRQLGKVSQAALRGSKGSSSTSWLLPGATTVQRPPDPMDSVKIFGCIWFTRIEKLRAICEQVVPSLGGRSGLHHTSFAISLCLPNSQLMCLDKNKYCGHFVHVAEARELVLKESSRPSSYLVKVDEGHC